MATKTTIPHINTALNADGTLNAQAAMAGAQLALDQAAAGNIDIDGWKVHQSDGVSQKPGRTKKVHIRVEFDRHE